MAGTIIPADLEIDMDGADPDQPGDIKVVKGNAVVINTCDSSWGWSIVGATSGKSISLSGDMKEGIASVLITLSSDTTQAIVKFQSTSTPFDITGCKYIKAWDKINLSTSLGGTITALWSFGESTWNEQNSTAMNLTNSWVQRSWLISSVTSGSRDAVTRFAVTVNSSFTVASKGYRIDYVIGDPGPSKIKAYDGDATIQLYPKFQSGIYTATTEAPRTIILNKSGTPSHIRIQNITTGDATANDEVVWYSGMTQYYAARTGGAVAPSTDMVIDVGDSYFTVATDDRVNQATRNYGYCVMWNDTTG